jgi:hypothetical protein
LCSATIARYGIIIPKKSIMRKANTWEEMASHVGRARS